MKKKIISLLLCFMIMITTACSSLFSSDSEEVSDPLPSSTAETKTATPSYSAAATEYGETYTDMSWDAGSLDAFCIRDDRTLTAFNIEKGFYTSSDNGETWIPEDSSWYEEWLSGMPENKRYGTLAVLTPDGSVLAGINESENELSLEEILDGKDPGLFFFSYIYKAPGQEPVINQIAFGSDTSIFQIVHLSGDRFIAYLGSRQVYEFEVSTGKSRLLFEDRNSLSIGVVGNLVIASSDKSVTLYDTEKQMLLTNDTVLDDFVKRNTQQMTNAFWTGAEENTVYIVCSKGLFRHIIGGTSIELVIEGGKNSLGFESNIYRGIFLQEDGKFLIPLSDSTLLYYTPGVAAIEPEKTITIYSLYEHSELQELLHLYQIKHPELLIEYEIGGYPGNGKTREDAISALNTELLSGKGPDILILDDIPAASYIEKGVLMDLSDMINAMEEELFPSIVDSYRTETGIYQFPCRFDFLMMAGPKEQIENITDLASLADAIETLLSMNPAELISLRTYTTILPFCTNAIINEDGSINKEALKELLIQSERIATALDERAHLIWGKEFNDFNVFTKQEPFEQYRLQEIFYYCQPTISMDTKFLIGSVTWIDYFYMVVSYINESGQGKTDFAFFSSSGQNLFMPFELLSINNNSPETEEAVKLIRYLLSEDAQGERKGSWYPCRLPVNALSFKSNLVNYEPYMRYTQEQLTRLRDQIASLNAPVSDNVYLRDIITEAMIKICEEGTSTDEAVKYVVDKMELYLME